MIRILFIAIFILIAPPLASDTVGRALVTYQGQAGYWFSEDVGDRMLGDLEELKINREKLVLYGKELELKDERIKYAMMELELYGQIVEKYKLAMATSEELREKEVDRCVTALEAKDAWYRSPVFNFMVGFVAAGALAVGLAFGLENADIP